MDISTLTTFLLYLSVINIIFYVLVVLMIIYFKDRFVDLHLRIFGIAKKNKEEFVKLCYLWIGRYKSMIIFFNIMPLIALKLMA